MTVLFIRIAVPVTSFLDLDFVFNFVKSAFIFRDSKRVNNLDLIKNSRNGNRDYVFQLTKLICNKK